MDDMATATTTSAGMPHLHAMPGALDAGGPAAKPANPIQTLVDQGKAQVTGALDGVAGAAHDLASRLEGNGIGPVADYVRHAAEAVTTWSATVDRKSIDELASDTRAFVRRSPLLAVSLTVAAGFLLSRYFRATSPMRTGR